MKIQLSEKEAYEAQIICQGLLDEQSKYDPEISAALGKASDNFSRTRSGIYDNAYYFDDCILPYIKNAAELNMKKYSLIISQEDVGRDSPQNYRMKLDALANVADKVDGCLSGRYVPDVFEYLTYMSKQEELQHMRDYKKRDAVTIKLSQGEMSTILSTLDHTHLNIFTDSCANHLALDDKLRHEEISEMDYIKALQKKVYKTCSNCEKEIRPSGNINFSGREALTVIYSLRLQHDSGELENKIMNLLPRKLKQSLSDMPEFEPPSPHLQRQHGMSL